MKKKLNPKIFALIIELVIFVVAAVFLYIYHYVFKQPLIIWPIVIITVIWIFALVITLSRIRYDSIRELRSSGYYTDNDNNRIFLNIYDDNTSLTCHDLKDENSVDKKE